MTFFLELNDNRPDPKSTSEVTVGENLVRHLGLLKSVRSFGENRLKLSMSFSFDNVSRALHICEAMSVGKARSLMSELGQHQDTVDFLESLHTLDYLGVNSRIHPSQGTQPHHDRDHERPLVIDGVIRTSHRLNLGFDLLLTLLVIHCPRTILSLIDHWSEETTDQVCFTLLQRSCGLIGPKCGSTFLLQIVARLLDRVWSMISEKRSEVNILQLVHLCGGIVQKNQSTLKNSVSMSWMLDHFTGLGDAQQSLCDACCGVVKAVFGLCREVLFVDHPVLMRLSIELESSWLLRKLLRPPTVGWPWSWVEHFDLTQTLFLQILRSSPKSTTPLDCLVEQLGTAAMTDASILTIRSRVVRRFIQKHMYTVRLSPGFGLAAGMYVTGWRTPTHPFPPFQEDGAMFETSIETDVVRLLLGIMVHDRRHVIRLELPLGRGRPLSYRAVRSMVAISCRGGSFGDIRPFICPHKNSWLIRIRYPTG